MGLMHTRRKKPLSDPETSSSSSDFSHEESPDQSNGGLTSKLLEEHNHIHRPYSKLQPPFIGSIRQAKKQTQAQQEYAYTTRQHLCAGSSPAYDEYGYEYSDRGEYGAVTGEANGFSIRRRLEEKHTALLRQREHLMTCQRVSYGTVGGRHYPTQFMHQQHSLTRVGSGSCGSSRSRCILEYLTPPSYAEAMSVAELAEITHSRAHVASSERSWRTLSGGRSDKSGTSRGRFSQLDAHAEDLGPDELQLLMEKYQMGGYMETESDESSECIEVEDDEDEEDLGKLSVTNSVVNTFTRIMESQDHFFFEDHFRISLGSDMDEEEKNKGIELDMTNQLVVLNETQILSNIEEEKSQEPEKQVVSHEKQAAITERMASPIPAETKAEIDTNLLIARLYEKILTLTKKQYALASSSSKQEEKNSVDEELRQLYQQLNEITLVQE
jgi:hypothetical protein